MLKLYLTSDEFSSSLTSKFDVLQKSVLNNNSPNVVILNELKELKECFAQLQAKQENLVQENISLKKRINDILSAQSAQSSSYDQDSQRNQSSKPTFKSALQKNISKSPNTSDKAKDQIKARLNNDPATTLSTQPPKLTVNT